MDEELRLKHIEQKSKQEEKKQLQRLDHEQFFFELRMKILRCDIRLDRRMFGQEKPYVQWTYDDEVYREYIQREIGQEGPKEHILKNIDKKLLQKFDFVVKDDCHVSDDVKVLGVPAE